MDNFFQPPDVTDRRWWPKCFGTLCFPRTNIDEGRNWFSTGSQRHDTTHRCLLFEYIPNLKPLTNDLIDDRVATGFKNIVAKLHALNVVHNDHVDRSAWPEIRFGNVFIRPDPDTGLNGTQASF